MMPHRSVAALFLVGLASLASAAEPVDKPNIVLIMADDLGYGELGCYGQKWIKTPHIDSLARNGMRFTQFYSGSPVCASARCVLMTGKHTGHAFIRTNREVKPEGQLPIPAEAVTVAELLQQRGYATAAVGKWGLGMFDSTGSPLKQGFDFFYGYNCQRHAHNHFPKYLWRNDERETLEGNSRTATGAQHSQDLFVREALGFIRAHREKPFFLYFPATIPHLSIQTTDRWLKQYQGQIPEAAYQHRGYLKHPFPRAGYAAMVTQLDAGVGEILKQLDELQLADRTIVIFTSDNGPTFDRLGGSDSDFFESSGGLRGRKGSVYEGGIRVPLVVRWPGQIEPGSVSEHPAAFYDLLPTLVELAGGRVPHAVDGVSFLSELRGEQQPPHEFLYWEFPSYGGQQAVRLGKYKGVRQNLMRKDANLKVELYDLEADPRETRDIAEERPEIVAQIERIMACERTRSAEFPFSALDALDGLECPPGEEN